MRIHVYLEMNNCNQASICSSIYRGFVEAIGREVVHTLEDLKSSWRCKKEPQNKF